MTYGFGPHYKVLGDGTDGYGYRRGSSDDRPIAADLANPALTAQIAAQNRGEATTAAAEPAIAEAADVRQSPIAVPAVGEMALRTF